MIVFNISYIQILVIILVTLVTLKLLKILTTLLISSPFFFKWTLKRQAKRKRLVEVNQREEMYRDLSRVAKTLDWIDSQLPSNKEKKHFWKEFALTKSTRQFWIDNLLKQFEAPQIIVKKDEK